MVIHREKTEIVRFIDFWRERSLRAFCLFNSRVFNTISRSIEGNLQGHSILYPSPSPVDMRLVKISLQRKKIKVPIRNPGWGGGGGGVGGGTLYSFRWG